MSTQRFSSQKILSAIIVFTILLAAAAALLSASKPKVQYSVNSPEGVVQRYLEAVIDGRNERAAEFFAANSSCDATDIDRSWIPESLRINLAESDIEGNQAFIELAIDISSGGPFDDYYTETHNFRLIRESEGWRILGIPWPLYNCEELGK